MDILEREVAPLFFERHGLDYPREWTQRVARSIMTLAPAFSAQRMVREYAQRVYLPAGATYGQRPGGSAVASSCTRCARSWGRSSTSPA